MIRGAQAIWQARLKNAIPQNRVRGQTILRPLVNRDRDFIIVLISSISLILLYFFSIILLNPQKLNEFTVEYGRIIASYSVLH